MEKKKNIKTRFMAGALALMLSGAHVPNGYAIQNENQYENQVVTLQTIEESLSKSGELDEEYAKYLEDNGIEVIDGNIKVETVEQFKIVKDYYYKYYEENNLFEENYISSQFDDMDKFISNNIFFINYEELGDELKKQLIKDGIVIIDDEFYDMCLYFLYLNAKTNEGRILEGNDNLITSKNIFFNNDIRTLQAMFEEDLKVLAIVIKNEDYDMLNTFGDKYLGYLFDKGLTYQPDFFSLSKIDKVNVGRNLDACFQILVRNQYRFVGEYGALLSECHSYENEINTVKEKALELTKK